MRKILSEQVQMGEVDISTIEIELDNRDEIPQLLRGLQYIYSNDKVRNKVFKLLWEIVPEGTDVKNGRNGMNLWRILVFGTLRLNCNWDYDKLQEIANNHFTLRQMLGHGLLDFTQRYHRQTLNDNLRWFTQEVLDKINKVVVDAGIELLDDIDKEKAEHCRCDSFVVETNVHFPTDLSLLWDAVRKSMKLSYKIAEQFEYEGWRQTPHNLKKVRCQFRAVQNERNRDEYSKECIKATQEYIDTSMGFLKGAEIIAEKIKNDPLYCAVGEEIEYFVAHGKKQIGQIVRRCFMGEKIPHDEKTFSLFEEYTEWIEKGKAGVPQELGLRVCIVENRIGFIIHYRIMQHETDDKVAIPIAKEILKKYSTIKSCSFDKGFHSPENQRVLAELFDFCILPRKGKLTDEDKLREGSEAFVEKRQQHAAVESAINALENHGLDRCCDHGLNGFKRYVALAVLARNIQLIGTILWKRELESLERKKVA